MVIIHCNTCIVINFNDIGAKPLKITKKEEKSSSDTATADYKPHAAYIRKDYPEKPSANDLFIMKHPDKIAGT